jgi:cytochrome oxidase assembly protein ShyY1
MKPGWRMTLLVVCMLPLLVGLGVWQVKRGDYKRGLETAYLERLTQLPREISEGAAPVDEASEFLRLRLTGRYASEAFLVDNQVHRGTVGYWLVHVFDANDARRYLVNRGFVAGEARRDRIPEVDAPDGEVRLLGVLWPDTGLIPVLDEDEWADGWPKRVQRADIERMARTVGAEPFEVRLEPGQAGVSIAAPFAQVLSDAKHRGYAATWFGLAAAVMIGYAAYGVYRAREALTQRGA